MPYLWDFLYLNGPFGPAFSTTGGDCFFICPGYNCLNVWQYDSYEDCYCVYSSSATTLPVNAWFSLELGVNQNSVQLYLNGISILNSPLGDTPSGNFNAVNINAFKTSSNSYPTVYFDDIAVSNTYIGP